MKQYKLDKALKALNIDGTCIKFEQHRHLAFYDVKLAPGTLVSRIERRTREIALEIQSKTAPIVKLIPEEGIVRLHVAMQDSDILKFSDLYQSAPKNMALPVLLGESDLGKKLWTDLASHPHTLVAGGTGSGKSVFLHNLIANIQMLNANGICDIKVYLSDPKRVEFNVYESQITKGLIEKVVYDYHATIAMLEYLEIQMEARYEVMSELGIQNIAERKDLFPYILVVIDEVADLMMQDKKTHEFETLLIRLAQKARAAGIHLVLATQRPSRDVLTGTIKANFPSRVSFRVSSRVDSLVVLDSIGAENLLGRGDAVLKNLATDYIRFQGLFIEPREVLKLIQNNDRPKNDAPAEFMWNF